MGSFGFEPCDFRGPGGALGSIDKSDIHGYDGRMTPPRAKPVAIAGSEPHIVRIAGR
jgi:hypothetical protein